MSNRGGKTSGLSYVADFVREVQRNLTPGTPADATGLWFVRAERSLFLSREESATYGAVLNRLVKEHGRGEDASHTAISNWLVDALFEALDLSGSNTDIESRLCDAVARLHRRLTGPLDSYTCYLSVHGLATEGLPRVLGRVRFVVMNKRLLDKLAKETGLSPDDGILKNLKTPDFWGQPLIEVTVQARDHAAAQRLAQHQARRAIDALNFVAGLSTYNHGFVYLPGEAESCVVGRVVVCLGGSTSLGWGAAGPFQPLSFAQLKQESALLLPMRKIGSVMASPSEVGDLLATAVQWAGRAWSSPGGEQAFLLLSVAIETLMLPSDDRLELGYRLRMRVARLLGHSAVTEPLVRPGCSLVRHPIRDSPQRLIRGGGRRPGRVEVSRDAVHSQGGISSPHRATVDSQRTQRLVRGQGSRLASDLRATSALNLARQIPGKGCSEQLFRAARP